MPSKFKNKIVLITGATGGLGQALTKRYIDLGAHVITIGRNIEILESLDDYAQSKGSSTTIVKLDLKEFSKIKNLAQEISKRFGRIDIFISAAAMLGEVSPITHSSEKVWDRVMQTNFTANFHLIQNLHPLLTMSEQAEALFVTCRMSTKNKAYWGAYTASKAALEELVQTYAEETKTTNIKVNLVDPGAISTKLRCAAFPGKNKDDYRKPEEILDLFVTIPTRTNIISGMTISHKELLS